MVSKKSELLEWVKALGIAVILALVVRQFLFAPIVVDGSSMMPTLEDKDRMIVNKLSYRFNEPERFDIIVFHAPENKDYIKRVIGLPGEVIEYRKDTLFVNGQAVEEPYLKLAKSHNFHGPLTESFSLEEIPEISQHTVPEGHLFVLGDNRQWSKDSRHIGTVPIDQVLGKTNLIYWPLNDIRKIE